jgi:general secretion pathway protein G
MKQVGDFSAGMRGVPAAPLSRGEANAVSGGLVLGKSKPPVRLRLTPPLTGGRQPGFTLIELLVVLSIVALLLSIAVPRYYGSLDKSKEAVLKENLYQVRDAIGKYYADKGKYPESLEALAADKYLRNVPLDPITDSTATWVVVPPAEAQKGGVYDVKSGAPGKAKDGSEYSQW